MDTRTHITPCRTPAPRRTTTRSRPGSPRPRWQPPRQPCTPCTHPPKRTRTRTSRRTRTYPSRRTRTYRTHSTTDTPSNTGQTQRSARPALEDGRHTSARPVTHVHHTTTENPLLDQLKIEPHPIRKKPPATTNHSRSHKQVILIHQTRLNRLRSQRRTINRHITFRIRLQPPHHLRIKTPHKTRPRTGHRLQRRREAVLLGRPVDVPQQASRTGVRETGGRVNGDPAHARRVECQPAVGECRSGDVVASALDTQQQAVVRGEVHQALATTWLEVLLRGAPTAQCERPLLHAAEVEDPAAGEDHGTADDSGGDRRHPPGCHRHHRPVQHRQALRRPALRDQRLALPQPPNARRSASSHRSAISVISANERRAASGSPPSSVRGPAEMRRYPAPPSPAACPQACAAPVPAIHRRMSARRGGRA